MLAILWMLTSSNAQLSYNQRRRGLVMASEPPEQPKRYVHIEYGVDNDVPTVKVEIANVTAYELWGTIELLKMNADTMYVNSQIARQRQDEKATEILTARSLPRRRN